MLRIPNALLGALAGLLIVVGAHQPRAAAAADLQDVLDCYRAHASAYFCDTFGNCSLKHKIGTVYNKRAQRCTREALACELAGDSGADTSSCEYRASAVCFRKFDSYLDRSRAKFGNQRDEILHDCGPLDFSTDILSASGTGLGFEGSAARCEAMGIPLETLQDVIDCSDAVNRCEVEKVAALITPRGAQALSDLGFDDEFAAEGCMVPSLPGDAASFLTKSMVSCVKALHIFSRRYRQKRKLALSECLDEIFRCIIEQKDCSNAEHLCKKKIAHLPVESEDFVLRAAKKCAKVSFADLRSGMGLGAPGHGCSGVGSTEALMTCIGEKIDCSVDRVLFHLKPRAAEMLGEVPFGDDIADTFVCLQ